MGVRRLRIAIVLRMTFFMDHLRITIVMKKVIKVECDYPSLDK